MNLKRIFRSPLAWIVLAVIAIGLLIDFSQRVTSGYKEAPTSQVVSIINGNEPLSEVILIDKEQEIRVTLKDANHTGYKATWVGNQAEDQIIPPARQREMAARLGVEPIEIASEHAVFALRPRELAAVLAG